MENLILSMPKYGWCNFRLSDEEKEFTAALSYLTDVMYDNLKDVSDLSPDRRSCRNV